jgi:DNA-binding transcriptional regulator YhcF (GntR family)
MSSFAIGDLIGWQVAAAKSGRRIADSVRRTSYDENDRRAQIFRPICGGNTNEALRWRDKLLVVAREYNTIHKAKGEREGPLGSNGLWVLEVLLSFIDFQTGRCDPAIDTICAKARLARATVVRAIETLKQHGFIDKVRRTRKTGNRPTEGPQREQISNAYAFATALKEKVRQRFAQLVGGRRKAQEIQEAKKRKAEARAEQLRAPASMLGSMLYPDNPQMAGLLDRIGAHIERESASSTSREYPDPVFKGGKE